jgi:hypothetical protein
MLVALPFRFASGLIIGREFGPIGIGGNRHIRQRSVRGRHALAIHRRRFSVVFSWRRAIHGHWRSPGAPILSSSLPPRSLEEGIPAAGVLLGLDVNNVHRGLRL